MILRIQADAEAKQMLQFFCDIVLKQEGMNHLQSTLNVLGAIQLVEDAPSGIKKEKQRRVKG